MRIIYCVLKKSYTMQDVLGYSLLCLITITIICNVHNYTNQPHSPKCYTHIMQDLGGTHQDYKYVEIHGFIASRDCDNTLHKSSSLLCSTVKVLCPLVVANQEIWLHKITNAYQNDKTWLSYNQLAVPNLMQTSQWFNLHMLINV